MSYTDDLIDYLMSPDGYDTCAKCVFYIEHTAEEYEQAGIDTVLPHCQIREDQGFNTSKDCREGMKQFFKRQAENRGDVS